MKDSWGITLLVLGGLMLLLASCEDFFYIDEEEMYTVSSHGTKASHHNGKDCMKCHSTGELIFTIAGSLYDSTGINPSPNGLIEFYSDVEGEGTLLRLLEVDALGNFYTTEAVTIENGFYPVVINNKGKRKVKNLNTTSGACNSCHGNTVEVIKVN